MKLKMRRKAAWLVALVLMGTSIPTMAQVKDTVATRDKKKEWNRHVLAPYVDVEEVAKYVQDKGLGYVGYYLVGEEAVDYAYGDIFAKYLVEDEDKEATDPGKPEQGVSKEHWRAGVSYEVGTIVKFQNNYFSCIQAHTSKGGWQPSKAPELWNRVPGDEDDLKDEKKNNDSTSKENKKDVERDNKK